MTTVNKNKFKILSENIEKINKSNMVYTYFASSINYLQ